MVNPTDKPALKLKRLQDIPIKGKRVLVRVDFNVPMKGGKVLDNRRMRESLETINYLVKAGAKVVLISHLGRPKGKPDSKYSLKAVAAELGNLMNSPVAFCDQCVGPAAEKAVAALKPGGVILLENLRFNPGEESNDPDFAKGLAKLGDVFVQDAFGAIHRAHASTAGVPRSLPGGIGFLIQRELEFLDRVMGNPERPFLAIIGGAKVSDKIGVMMKLLDRVDALVIGGGMAYTFLHAQGISIGKSLLEKDKVGEAHSIVEKSYSKKVECLLPADHLAAREIKAGADTVVTQAMAIPQDLIGVDIGPHSIEIFMEQIAKAKTIFWNGPMGIFEIEAFALGSLAIAKALAQATKKGAVTIVGGGDSLAVLSMAQLQDEMTHCSTGGGASLELLEGKTLPGLAALAAGA